MKHVLLHLPYGNELSLSVQGKLHEDNFNLKSIYKPNPNSSSSLGISIIEATLSLLFFMRIIITP
jgi:hypothetical protein